LAQRRSVKLTDFVEGPRQELIATAAIYVHIALVVDRLVAFLIMIDVEAIFDEVDEVVFPQRDSLTASAVKASVEDVYSATGQRRFRKASKPSSERDLRRTAAMVMQQPAVSDPP
jgi:hypothetical protein